jgi:hypothetical protein
MLGPWYLLKLLSVCSLDEDVRPVFIPSLGKNHPSKRPEQIWLFVGFLAFSSIAHIIESRGFLRFLRSKDTEFPKTFRKNLQLQNYNVLSPSSYTPTCISLRDIYFKDRFAYSAAGKFVDRSWEYINRSQTHKCGNESAQFSEKGYRNGIFLAVHRAHTAKEGPVRIQYKCLILNLIHSQSK